MKNRSPNSGSVLCVFAENIFENEYQSNKHCTSVWWKFLLLTIFILLTACEQQTQPQGPTYSPIAKSSKIKIYRLAIHPLHNPKKLTESYQPLLEYLNNNIQGIRIQLEASRDYQAFEAKFRARQPELILPNPWQTLEAMKVGYKVVAMAGDADDFKGIFIIRKDSNIKSVKDVIGKTFSYPSPTALAACIMPQYFLYTNQIDINKDITNSYVGSQESAILHAYLKQSDIGVTWPPPWRQFQKDHPQEANKLTVIWETPPLLNNSIMLRDDLSAEFNERIKILLFQLGNTIQGREILKSMETAKFYPANNASYTPVHDFIQQFEKQVRPVESK